MEKKNSTIKKVANKNSTKKTTDKKKTINKQSKKKKKGFTLIELLAVIIILGILMIVAIPAVTSYINDSRKSAYVDTAKEIVAGTRSIVNEGKLGLYDTNTTYYLPYDLVKTENSSKSPYGNFTEAYAVVTFNGNGYDYYWTSIDDSNIGINLSYSGNLENDDIKSDLKGISTDVAICGKENIKVLNSKGQIIETKEASDCIEEHGKYEGSSDSCKYKLVTNLGSFSNTEDIKEICVSVDSDYSFNTLSRMTDDMYRCDQQNYTILNVTVDNTKINDDFYFRVYDSSEKNQLLAEIKKSDFPKYSFYLSSLDNISTYVGVTKVFPKSGTGLYYYIEYSQDYENEFIVGNAGYEYYCSATVPESLQYDGGWLKKESDIRKVNSLIDHLQYIPLTSVCSNSNPQGGIDLVGFTNCNDNGCSGNTYYAQFNIKCENSGEK